MGVILLTLSLSRNGRPISWTYASGEVTTLAYSYEI